MYLSMVMLLLICAILFLFYNHLWFYLLSFCALTVNVVAFICCPSRVIGKSVPTFWVAFSQAAAYGRYRSDAAGDLGRSSCQFHYNFFRFCHFNSPYLNYYLEHKYIDSMGIGLFISIGIIEKPPKHVRYLIIRLWVSTHTCMWIF